MSGSTLFVTECTVCRRGYPQGFVPFCQSCGAMTDVTYDLDRVTLGDSSNPYIRFSDLLPVVDTALMPDDATYTPTVHAQRLGEELGIPWLYLKDETGLPTGTTKDRMAAVALPYLYECGVRRFATSSTGNSSSAYAHAISRVPGVVMFLFTASRFRDRLTLEDSQEVVDVVLDGATFVEAFDAARIFAESHEITAERGFFNPGRREGLKLAWLEASDQVARHIDYYVQAVSSAMGVYGVYKAARELHELGVAGPPPGLVCVQEDTCAPMVSAWRDGSDEIRPEHVVANPQGIAAAIQRGDPSRAYPHVLRIVRESHGNFVAVSEGEIREAAEMVRELEGISVCFAAAAAVAGLARLRRLGTVPAEATILVNLTGGNRVGTAPTDATKWIARVGEEWDFGDLEAEVGRWKAHQLPPPDR
jgi:threonine synthase